MDAVGLGRRPMAVCLQTLDQFSDILVALPAGHQHHVRRGGDDEILDPERRDQLPVAADVTARGVFHHRIANHHIARRILFRH